MHDVFFHVFFEDGNIHLEFLIHILDHLWLFRFGEGEGRQVVEYDTNICEIQKCLEDMM